jgi:methionine synthase II (cobalamin-independent)
MAVRTTVVGSWWPLEEYEEDLRRYHRGELSTEEGERALTGAAAQAIEEQRELGLDEWTGGEYFTEDFIMHIVRKLSGIEIDHPGEEEIFDYDDFAHAVIVGELSAPSGLGYAEGYERERELPGGVRKATVISPLEVTVNSLDQVDELNRQLPNVTAIVNAELKRLAELGCPHVVLDAPKAGAEVNMGTLTVDQAVEIIAPCFEGVEGVTRGIHICNGNLRGRPISGVLSCAPWVDILKGLEGVIDVAHLELSYFSEWLERDAFKALPKSMELAAGIVDEATYGVESVKKIRDRAADWARVVGEERLWVAPSCGFGRHPGRNRLVLRQKVENMVEAASSL